MLDGGCSVARLKALGWRFDLGIFSVRRTLEHGRCAWEIEVAGLLSIRNAPDGDRDRRKGAASLPFRSHHADCDAGNGAADA